MLNCSKVVIDTINEETFTGGMTFEHLTQKFCVYVEIYRLRFAWFWKLLKVHLTMKTAE